MDLREKFLSITRRLVASCVLAVCSFASSYAQTALPDDLAITPPSSNVPPDVAAFSGAWLGSWEGELPTGLVVEQVRSNGTAHVIYSWGDSAPDEAKADWSNEKGRISHGKLKLSSKDGPKIDFTMQPGGFLLGRYELDQRPSYAELHQIPTTNVTAILAAAEKAGNGWKEIHIPVHSQVGPIRGKNFELQTTIYRQSSPGRHPVVICNHGSTGPGLVPENLVYRGGNVETLLHSLGYVVVIPMRKGRGSSDGPNLEEDNSVAPSVQLDSAIEDLQAVVKYVSHQPDIDPTKIVLTGVSRGGFLSVAYAGRYPTNVARVINFSGGWFGERMPTADFNFETFAQAGHTAKVPMLWLYADHDSFYSLKFVEKEFAKFREAGGQGELVELQNIPHDGHLLFLWVDRWQDKVIQYLKGL